MQNTSHNHVSCYCVTYIMYGYIAMTFAKLIYIIKATMQMVLKMFVIH